jgi:hypothetical protein
MNSSGISFETQHYYDTVINTLAKSSGDLGAPALTESTLCNMFKQYFSGEVDTKLNISLSQVPSMLGLKMVVKEVQHRQNHHYGLWICYITYMMLTNVKLMPQL